jgi:hypothetical protein
MLQNAFLNVFKNERFELLISAQSERSFSSQSKYTICGLTKPAEAAERINRLPDIAEALNIVHFHP